MCFINHIKLCYYVGDIRIHATIDRKDDVIIYNDFNTFSDSAYDNSYQVFVKPLIFI